MGAFLCNYSCLIFGLFNNYDDIFSKNTYISKVFLNNDILSLILDNLEIFEIGQIALTNRQLLKKDCFIDSYSKKNSEIFFRSHFKNSPLPEFINDGKSLFFLRFYNEMVIEFSKLFFNKVYRNGNRVDYDCQKEFWRGKIFSVNNLNKYEPNYFPENYNESANLDQPQPLFRTIEWESFYSTIESESYSVRFPNYLNNFSIINIKNQMVVVGGQEWINGKFIYSKKIYILDLRTNEIKLLPFELNYSRINFRMFFIDGKICVHGGLSQTTNSNGFSNRLEADIIEIIDLENEICEIIDNNLNSNYFFRNFRNIIQFKFNNENYQIGLSIHNFLCLNKKENNSWWYLNSPKNSSENILSFCYFSSRIYFLNKLKDNTIYWEYYDILTENFSNILLENRLYIPSPKYQEIINNFEEIPNLDILDGDMAGVGVPVFEE